MITKLKICGMKHNTSEVASLQPDYLGYIFYDGSPRNFEGKLPEIPSEIKKVGVFVDAEVEFISEKIKTHKLDVIQLHGNETADFCRGLKDIEAVEIPVSSAVEIWKVFSIKDEFDFDRLLPYETVVDKFLFDTKGKQKGGTGLTFDWSVLMDYPLQVPIVLSGGIGLEEAAAIEAILATDLPIEIIDVNSRFEVSPGKKDVIKLKQFIDRLSG